MSFTNKIVDKVYVINLEKDTERLESISTSLHSQNIEFERFNAILGSTVLEDSRITKPCNIFCTDGMKGCALSHRTVWETMIKNDNKYIMVLEDDSHINTSFDIDLQLLWDTVPEDFDILYLGSHFYCGDSSFYNRITTAAFQKNVNEINSGLYQVEGCGGFHAYIISRNCAKKFVEQTIAFHIDIDAMTYIKENNLKAYAYQPVLVTSGNNESNLSSSYPPLLTSLISKVVITNQRENKSLDFFLNAYIGKLGPIEINPLMIIIFVFSFLMPLKYYFFIYLWLLTEFILSSDLKHTFHYIILISISFLIKKTFFN
jgi:hypothetical protein